MSNVDILWAKLEAIEEQNRWIIAALKHLLDPTGELTPRSTSDEDWTDDLDAWLEEPEEDTSQYEHIAVRTPPKPPQAPQCTHQHQSLVDGVLQCARCGYQLLQTGVVQNRVAPGGQVVADPNPPRWATERSPGASSKNPGAPLVPHMVE